MYAIRSYYGRFDIAYALSSLSRYSMGPSEGHVKAMKRVFGYLREFSNGRIMIDISDPPIRKLATITSRYDWKEFYPDCESYNFV